jgi:hypothetical protein
MLIEWEDGTRIERNDFCNRPEVHVTSSQFITVRRAAIREVCFWYYRN